MAKKSLFWRGSMSFGLVPLSGGDIELSEKT